VVEEVFKFFKNKIERGKNLKNQSMTEKSNQNTECAAPPPLPPNKKIKNK
jgi:hypothetical protein